MAGARDATGWMWSQACDLLEEADRLHRQFFRPAQAPQARLVWQPPADVFEDAQEIVVVVAMPGVDPARIQVTAVPGSVTVRGERAMPLPRGRYALRQLEIPYGTFERRIALPAHMPLQMQPAEVVNGCIVLRLRKLGREAP